MRKQGRALSVGPPIQFQNMFYWKYHALIVPSMAMLVNVPCAAAVFVRHGSAVGEAEVAVVEQGA